MKKYSAVLFLTLLLTSCNSAKYQSQIDTESAFPTSTNADPEVSAFTSAQKENTDVSEAATTTETNISYELSEFTLAEPEHVKLRDDDSFATFNFDDNELIDLFDEAWYIKTFYFECLNGRSFFSNYGEITDENGQIYTRSGVSFDSFVDFLNNYFTEEYTAKLLDTGITEYGDQYIIVPYKNVNGELCCGNGFERGTSPALDSISVNITEQKEDEMLITVTARYCHPDTPDEEHFNDFDCIVKMTENGWRVDYLKLWYWGR